MSKVGVTVHYPVRDGILCIHKTEVVPRIKINKLVSLLKREIDLSHMGTIDVHIARWDNFKFYSAKNKRFISLVEGDMIHLLGEKCSVFEGSDNGFGEGKTNTRSITFDVPYLNEDEFEQCQLFMKNVAWEAEKFRGIDLDALTKLELLNVFADVYIFYYGFMPKSSAVNTTDHLAVAKMDVIINYMKLLRESARLRNIEKELSVHLTNLDFDLFHVVLRKNNKDKFGYFDDMTRARELYDEMVKGFDVTDEFDKNLAQILEPRFLLCNESIYEKHRDIYFFLRDEQMNKWGWRIKGIIT